MHFLLSYLGKNFHLEADVGVPGEGDEEPGHDYHPWLHHLQEQCGIFYILLYVKNQIQTTISLKQTTI